jgi:hypothetical protein
MASSSITARRGLRRCEQVSHVSVSIQVWEEASSQIQTILMHLYEGIPASPADWCLLEDSEGHSYYCK